jgi:hypothetical protein
MPEHAATILIAGCVIHWPFVKQGVLVLPIEPPLEFVDPFI